MSKKRKPNPRRIPCSAADVAKARQDGQETGMNSLLTLFLWVWCEEFNATTEDVQRMGDRIHFYAKELHEGRLKSKDIMEALKDEHDWTIEIN